MTEEQRKTLTYIIAELVAIDRVLPSVKPSKTFFAPIMAAHRRSLPQGFHGFTIEEQHLAKALEVQP